VKDSVAIGKEADMKKDFSQSHSNDRSIHRVRNVPDLQLGSLRSVIDSIRRDGSSPSVESIATELSGMPAVQRASVLLALQQTHGNQYVQRVVTGIQAKLTVGKPGDIYEQEADRVADAVMRMPEPGVQRQPEEEEEEEEEEILKTKDVSGPTPEVASDFESRIHALWGGGQPLPEAVHTHFEPRFGHDFNNVIVHTDAETDKLARALNARALTVGQDIFFRQGTYNPGSSGGQELVAHELTHVVQQSARAEPMVQRDTPPGTAPEEQKKDPELEFGRKLWQEFPAGVTVAFYDRHEPVAVSRVKGWAIRERAIAAKRKPISAKNLVFGKAFPDSYDIKTTLPALGKVLTAASTKAGKPKAIQPLPGTGPSRIRVLAIFSHGSTGWLGIGSGITSNTAKSIIKSIAPALTTDVNVVLYACSAARSPSAKESWYKGTFKPGGAKSLAGVIRDALVEEGMKHAEVWGHTTGGHMTKNFALRIFYATHGKKQPGEAYAGEFVLGTVEEVIALLELEEEITKKGYTIPPEITDAFQREVYRWLSGGLYSLFYKCYAEADKKLKYRGVNLAEMAPVDPLGVAEVIEKYWKNTFWPKKKPILVNQLIRKFKLQKLPSSGE